MNHTLKELIYNLKNLKQAGRQSQDQLLSDSQYAFIIDYYRSILIKREYDKGRPIPSVFEQTLRVPISRLSTNSTINKSSIFHPTTPLPSVVQGDTRPLYSSIRKDIFSSAFDRSTTLSIRHDLNSPTTNRLTRWFPENQDLYIVTLEPLEEVDVTAVFEHPLQVEKWKFDNGQENQYDPYDPYNFEYPMSLKLVDMLYKMMIQGELNFSLSMPNDIQADGNEESAKISRPKTKVDSDNEG